MHPQYALLLSWRCTARHTSHRLKNVTRLPNTSHFTRLPNTSHFTLHKTAEHLTIRIASRRALYSVYSRTSSSRMTIFFPVMQMPNTWQELQAPFTFKVNSYCVKTARRSLTLRRRIKSHLLFAGIIRSSPFSLR